MDLKIKPFELPRPSLLGMTAAAARRIAPLHHIGRPAGTIREIERQAAQRVRERLGFDRDPLHILKDLF